MATLIERLQSDIADRERRTAEIDRQVASLQDERNRLAVEADYARNVMASVDELPPTRAAAFTTAVGTEAADSLSMPAAAQRVLQEAGGPLPLPELFDRMMNSGLFRTTSDRRTALASFRSMFVKDAKRGMKRWVRVRRGVWGLYGRDVPEPDADDADDLEDEAA